MLLSARGPHIFIVKALTRSICHKTNDCENPVLTKMDKHISEGFFCEALSLLCLTSCLDERSTKGLGERPVGKADDRSALRMDETVSEVHSDD